MLMGLRLLGPKAGHLCNKEVLGLFPPMKKLGFLLASLYQRLRQEHESEATRYKTRTEDMRASYLAEVNGVVQLGEQGVQE
jgi:hypothetical protein